MDKMAKKMMRDWRRLDEHKRKNITFLNIINWIVMFILSLSSNSPFPILIGFALMFIIYSLGKY